MNDDRESLVVLIPKIKDKEDLKNRLNRLVENIFSNDRLIPNDSHSELNYRHYGYDYEVLPGDAKTLFDVQRYSFDHDQIRYSDPEIFGQEI